MRKLVLLATAAGLALSACGKKPQPATAANTTPAATDPATGATDPTAGAGAEGSTVGNVDLAASRADFIARAGSDTVYFNTDRYDIDAATRATLDAQAAWLGANPNINVTLEGHADERGTREYNLALGERRANSVRDYLAARGVPTGRMEVISYGKERPVATGSDESAWAQNRRAVTVIIGG